MPIPTPFHSRTLARCVSMRWKDWAGYYAVCAYDTYPEREYFALRHAAVLIDVTPLYKYEVCGPGAAAFLARVVVRDIGRLRVGRVVYCCWCDEHGKLLDDGTVARFDDCHFRLTSTEPALAWLLANSRGFEVTIRDSSREVAALSIQGPRSRDVVRALAGEDAAALPWFGTTTARIDRCDARVSRTGYTGDLGFEIWVAGADAEALWDAALAAGRPHGIEPCGLDAMDIARVEAGFILNGVDYFPANRCLIESRKSSPFEMGLGWTVQLERGHFNGQAALQREKQRGADWAFVGLETDWDELAALYARHRLPPHVSPAAWRTAVPVYDTRGGQVGYATSGAWSPLLKKDLAMAHVPAHFAAPGTELRIEATVEYARRTVRATVVRKPFFDPERKRA